MFEFDFSLLLRGQYHEMLVAGLLLSLKLAAVTLVFAVPLAMLVALLRLAPFRALQWLGFAYVESIRNVPLLAHMLFWYFAAPEWLPEDLKAWLYAGNIEAASAIVALTLYTAAFMSEDMRSGIRAVPTVQLEAAARAGLRLPGEHAPGDPPAGLADHRTAADLANPQPVEEHQHRHGDRRRRADVPGRPGGEFDLPQLRVLCLRHRGLSQRIAADHRRCRLVPAALSGSRTAMTTLELIDSYWLYFLVGQYPNGPLGGLALTLVLASLALLLALPLGILLGLARVSPWRWLRWPITALVFVVRGCRC